jgi:predicted DCC family thiol-disulfide oxidoreductase YuxK
MSEHPVMLYDGVCRFCNGALQTVIRHDPEGIVHFAPLQSQYAQQLIQSHPELKGVDSLMLVEEDGRIYVRSEAALGIAKHIGGWWRLLLVFRILPRSLRDWLYDGFARRRYRLFGKHDECLMPTAEIRSRFVDVPQQQRTGNQR